MLCANCASNQHETVDCTAASGAIGAAGTGTVVPDDEALDEDEGDEGDEGGASRLSWRKAALLGLGLAIVVAAVGGLIVLRGGGKPGAAKAGATAQAPTGNTVTLGCTITEVDDEVAAKCEWAREKDGVVFDGLRWDGDVLKGVLTVTLTDGRAYRAAEAMEVKVGPKAPITFLAVK